MKELPTKICRNCKKERYLFEFKQAKQRPDGLSTQCSDCMKKRRKLTENEIIRKNQPREAFSRWQKI